MKINITRIDRHFGMEARNEDGNKITMDSSPDFGGEGKGMRPMQLLLVALGGCTTIDVISILQKQKQEVELFDLEVNGERENVGDYSLFRSITLHFKLKGQLDPGKVKRAIKLSLEKYCSVAKTLEPTAKINYKISIN
ncbi:MAG: OsmC family protein [Bacteroidota bacterium]